MSISELMFLNLLEGKKGDTTEFSPIQLASLYTNSAFLVTVMDFLKDELWLQKQEDKKNGQVTSYKNFITPLFDDELEAVSFLSEFLVESGPSKLKDIKKRSKNIEAKILESIIDKAGSDQKEFLIHSLNTMSDFFIKEEKDQEGRNQEMGHQGPNLYRTFDNLDDIFDLNYKLDQEMEYDHETKERLYQRAGIGVQSGYSTILLALDQIDAAKGSSIVDLGSGYGRVGLVCSLMRPDLDFVGYEYVPHRVEVSNNACEELGLEDNLVFKVQDLSLKSFSIPIADIYYLYDPFSKETYEYILEQILEISRHKEVTIVTKGNANIWLSSMAEENGWPSPTVVDEGNLCIFKTN
ncbi:methyltransferase domain-containing protein [Halobacteriovorax sp. CON-3]|uniref:methyltransferase domain-containing protein n=1 Tax=Halobacteriovorax sp. CON-3 TaxID=3157710 RepID=UPI00371F62C3